MFIRLSHSTKQSNRGLDRCDVEDCVVIVW